VFEYLILADDDDDTDFVSGIAASLVCINCCACKMVAFLDA